MSQSVCFESLLIIFCACSFAAGGPGFKRQQLARVFANLPLTQQLRTLPSIITVVTDEIAWRFMWRVLSNQAVCGVFIGFGLCVFVCVLLRGGQVGFGTEAAICSPTDFVPSFFPSRVARFSSATCCGGCVWGQSVSQSVTSRWWQQVVASSLSLQLWPTIKTSFHGLYRDYWRHYSGWAQQ